MALRAAGTRGGSSLSVETIADERSFERLGPEWGRLFGSLSTPTPFLQHAWLLEWWRHYGRGTELAVHVARRDGALVGALPFCVESRFGLRVAHFLGGNQSVLRDVLVGADDHASVVERLADAAAASADVTDLYGVRRASRITAVDRESWTLVERLRSPYADLSDGWNDVYARLATTSGRRDDRRRRRQLENLGRLEVRVVTSATDLPPALEECFRVHELRWRDRPNMSWFGTPVGMRFHRAVVERLGPENVVRIVLLELDGRTVAFTFSFVLGDQLFGMTTGFDPAVGRFSPGRLVLLSTLEHAAEEGVRRAWLMGGPEAFKLRLADGVEPLYEAVGLARTRPGRVVASLRGSVLAVRMRAKHSAAARRLYYGLYGPVRHRLRDVVPGASR